MLCTQISVCIHSCVRIIVSMLCKGLGSQSGCSQILDFPHSLHSQFLFSSLGHILASVPDEVTFPTLKSQPGHYLRSKSEHILCSDPSPVAFSMFKKPCLVTFVIEKIVTSVSSRAIVIYSDWQRKN